MTFNFFDKSAVEGCLCSHFSIDRHLFETVLSKFDSVHESAYDFAKKLNIDMLANIDDCQILCRHITTANDGLTSIKSKGMLTLDRMFSEDTPLSSFLKGYEIEVYPEKHNMRIKNKTVYINGNDEPCSPCVLNPDYTIEKRITNIHCCDFNEEMAIFNTKLYHDKSEVEVFIAGRDEKLLEYQSVLNGPEILWTIGKIIHSIYKKTPASFLQDAWSRLDNMKRYILEFVVPLSAIETNTDYKSASAYLNHEEWFEYARFSRDDYFNDVIPLTFYRNIKLLEVGLDIMFDSTEEKHSQILPEYHISSSGIKVYREYNMTHI